MRIGPVVRRRFGRHERALSEAWRRIFVDLDSFVDRIRDWTDATRILEIGCGEGAVTERLVKRFTSARIVAIDVAPTVGRLFRGERSRVEFRQAFAEEVVAELPGKFDLVVLADVIHHVPIPLRRTLLKSASVALAPEGGLVFKDWARRFTPVHAACFLADRYLTGDDVTYLSESEMRSLAIEVFGANAVLDQAHIRPWRNNFVMLIRQG